MKLQNKLAFISDADSDSGRTIAKKLASEGANLALNSASGGSTIQSDLALYDGQNTKASVLTSSLDSSAEVETVVENILQTFGRIDILVHNHNRIERVSIEDCDDATFQAVVDANVKTAFLCVQAFGKRMAAEGNGQMVLVSSIHAEKPTGSSFLYSASKGAIKMLGREAALDLGRHGVRVNVVEMGPVAGDNERFASDISDLYLDYQRKIPSTELGTPEDLANMVWFLTLDESRYLNGADIRLDGGFVLHYMDHKMKP